MSDISANSAARESGFVKQVEHDDCYKAAVATVLGLSLEDVPNFYREAMSRPTATPNRCPEVYDIIRAWARKRGLAVLFLPTTGPVTVNDILFHTNRLNPDVPFILGGNSIYGCGHVVVVHRGQIVHDPAPGWGPDSGGVVAPRDDGQFEVTYFVPLPAWAQDEAAEEVGK